MRPHGLMWYVGFAALGALAGFGIAMTAVKHFGWDHEPPAWVWTN